MSASAESRSIAYSADSASDAGKIACQALRTHVDGETRATFAIAVQNDTAADAQMSAFVPDPFDLRHRTVVQSVVGPYADFSTNVELDCPPGGGLPELQIEIVGPGIDFSLVVPGVAGRLDAGQVALGRAAGVANGSVTGTLTALPAIRPRAVMVPVGPYVAGPRGAAYHHERDDETVRDTIAYAPPPRSPSVVPIFALFAALVAGAGIMVAHPQAATLDVPQRVRAGLPVSIGYHATGLGTLTYRVSGPDGALVETGPLAAGGGRFPFVPPRAGEQRTYLVHVALDGPLGGASSEAYLHVPAAAPRPSATVLAAPRVAPPVIRSLAVDRATLAGGETLNVYYDIAAGSGSVALVDGAAQIVYGRAVLSPSGRASFVVPAVPAPRLLSVTVTARRGGVTTESRIGITVSPPVPAAAPSDQAASATDTGGGPVAADAVPLVVAPKSVRSDAPIRIDVRGGVPGLTLILTDADGTELARRDVGAQSGGTIFRAPVVTSPARVRLQATYPRGAGTEMIVQTIVVVPR